MNYYMSSGVSSDTENTGRPDFIKVKTL